MKPCNVLLAVDDDAFMSLFGLLASINLRSVQVATSGAALTQLAKGEFTAVLIDVDFDGARMFELLKSIRDSYRSMTLICVRTRQRRTSVSCDQSTATAAKVIAGAHFVDMTTPSANDQLKQYLLRELGPISTTEFN